MKERGSGKPHARSSVSGSVIKMKVKKTSEDKQVQMYTVTLVETCHSSLSTERHQPQAATELFEQHVKTLLWQFKRWQKMKL